MVWLMMLVRMLDGIMRPRRLHLQYVPAYRPGSSGSMVTRNVWPDNMELGLGRLLWREVVRPMGTSRRCDTSSANQLGNIRSRAPSHSGDSPACWWRCFADRSGRDEAGMR